MHQNRTTSKARVSSIALLAAALTIAITSCTSQAATDTASPSPSVEETASPPTFAEMGSRLPTPEELDPRYENFNHCAIGVEGIAPCTAEALALRGSSKEWILQGSDLVEGVTDVTAGAVTLLVDEFDAKETADAHVARVRGDESKYMGDFSFPAETNDAGQLRAGAQGSGTSIDLERNGWAGFQLDYVSQLTDSDGALYVSDATPPGPTATSTVAVSQDNLSFVLRLYWMSPEPGIAEDEVEYWLHRVLDDSHK